MFCRSGTRVSSGEQPAARIDCHGTWRRPFGWSNRPIGWLASSRSWYRRRKRIDFRSPSYVRLEIATGRCGVCFGPYVGLGNHQCRSNCDGSEQVDGGRHRRRTHCSAKSNGSSSRAGIAARLCRHIWLRGERSRRREWFDQRTPPQIGDASRRRACLASPKIWAAVSGGIRRLVCRWCDSRCFFVDQKGSIDSTFRRGRSAGVLLQSFRMARLFARRQLATARRRRGAGLEQTLQRVFKKPSKATLNSSGISCWVQ